MSYVKLLLIGIVVYFMGWVTAHSTVANECKKLGSFYVGDTVYECKVKAKGE